MPLGNIPNDVKTPLFYMDFDNSQALDGTPAQVHRVLVIGQQSAGATVAPLELTRIGSSESQFDDQYGKGSMMARMLKAFRNANFYQDVYALGVTIDGGTAAVGEIQVAVTTAKAGVIYLLIDGESVQVTVNADDTDEDIAAAIIAEVNDDTNLPVTAALKAGETTIVELTCNWTGLTGNDLDIRYNYYDGEVLPAGVTLTIVDMVGGAGTPDMAEVAEAIPDEWYNHFSMPFNDTQSMNAIRDELINRWGPLQMMEAIAYTAYRGTYAETGTFGDSRNDFLFSCLGTNKSPQAPYLWSAVYSAIASYNLAIDPARPLQTLVLTGILPPAKEDRWPQFPERNNLLGDGIATYTVTAGGEVAIEREVSMYRVNSYGDPDPSYMDITTPATLGYLRYSMRNLVTNRFPRHKLADDNVLELLDPAQPVVTPKIMRQAIIELATIDWVPKGLMEDLDDFKETMSVYRDTSDKNRLNAVINPNLVNQLRVLATLNQFKL